MILTRADADKPNMGLNTWHGKRVTKSDVGTAKNYLDEAEISELNRIVVMWLDYAEDQARRRQQVFMQDWEQKLDAFLRFNEREVLDNAGQRSRAQAQEFAEAEYERFAEQRRRLTEAEGEKDIKALRQLQQRPAGTDSRGEEDR